MLVTVKTTVVIPPAPEVRPEAQKYTFTRGDIRRWLINCADAFDEAHANADIGVAIRAMVAELSGQ